MSGSEPAKPGDASEDVLHLGDVVGSGKSAEAPSTTQFIRKAVAETTAKKERQLVVPQEAGTLPPEVLLAVISYCYAKGVYSCREIEDAILQDTGLREQLGASLPDDRSLRRFRRLNRDAIKATLERAFIEAKRTLGHIPPDRLQAGCAAIASDATPDAQTAFLVKKAVDDRIQKALFIDGMTKDY